MHGTFCVATEGGRPLRQLRCLTPYIEPLVCGRCGYDAETKISDDEKCCAERAQKAVSLILNFFFLFHVIPLVNNLF